MGLAATTPFLFVAADAVQEIQHGILRVRRVARRCIDERLARVADGLGIVLDHLQPAASDAIAHLVEIVGFGREGARVIGAEFDWTAEATTWTLPAWAGRGSLGDDGAPRVSRRLLSCRSCRRCE
jgi:hypothetical protein